ncbi:MAG: alpha/beta hydrolase [Bacteroidales bacterium]|nr:alpha/beta hydrolase [Bacteroidales bacterium]
MKKASVLFLAVLVLAAACSAPSASSVKVGEEFNLYEGAAPGSEGWDWPEFRLDNPADGETYVANVSTPTLKAFLPESGKASGAAMIVCPGGGHQILSYSAEGTNVAQWLAEQGVAAFVLKYRLIHFAETSDDAFYYVLGLPEKQIPAERQEAYQAHRRVAIGLSNDDGRAAIAYVRSHAAEFGVDPDRIGIMGFSAGAGVTADVCFNHTPESRPDLVAPIYGGSFPGEVPQDAAPLFIAAPELDLRPGMTAISLYDAWRGASLPAELHYFAACEHGHGYKNNGDPVNDWILLLYHFMQKTGFVPAS